MICYCHRPRSLPLPAAGRLRRLPTRPRHRTAGHRICCRCRRLRAGPHRRRPAWRSAGGGLSWRRPQLARLGLYGRSLRPATRAALVHRLGGRLLADIRRRRYECVRTDRWASGHRHVRFGRPVGGVGVLGRVPRTPHQGAGRRTGVHVHGGGAVRHGGTGVAAVAECCCWRPCHGDGEWLAGAERMASGRVCRCGAVGTAVGGAGVAARECTVFGGTGS